MINRLIFDLDKGGEELPMGELETLAASLVSHARARGIKTRMVTTGTVWEVGGTSSAILEDDRGKNLVFKD